MGIHSSAEFILKKECSSLFVEILDVYGEYNVSTCEQVDIDFGDFDILKLTKKPETINGVYYNNIFTNPNNLEYLTRLNEALRLGKTFKAYNVTINKIELDDNVAYTIAFACEYLKTKGFDMKYVFVDSPDYTEYAKDPLKLTRNVKYFNEIKIVFDRTK